MQNRNVFDRQGSAFGALRAGLGNVGTSVIVGAGKATSATNAQCGRFFPEGLDVNVVQVHKATLTVLLWVLLAIPAAWIVHGNSDSRLPLRIAASLMGMAFGQTSALFDLQAYKMYLIVLAPLPIIGGLIFSLSASVKPDIGVCIAVTVVSVIFLAVLLYYANEIEGLKHEVNLKAVFTTILIITFIGAVLIIVGSVLEVNNEHDLNVNFALLGVGMASCLLCVQGLKTLESLENTGRWTELIFFICGLFVDILPVALELSLEGGKNNTNVMRYGAWTTLAVSLVAVVVQLIHGEIHKGDAKASAKDRKLNPQSGSEENEKTGGEQKTRGIEILMVQPAKTQNSMNNTIPPSQSLANPDSGLAQQHPWSQQVQYPHAMGGMAFPGQGFPGMPVAGWR